MPPAPPPSIGLARPTPAASRPGARIPVQCSPAWRLQSVRPLLPIASVHSRLTSVLAARLLPLLQLPPPPPPPPPLLPLQQPQPGRDQVSEGGRLQVSPPLCSARPLLSGPLPYALLPPHGRCPRPSRSAQGSRACQAVLPRQLAGGPLAPPPCSFPRAPLGGIPSPSPGPLPPTVTGGHGRGKGLGETEGSARRGRSTETGNTGWTHPYERKRGEGR